MRKTFLTSALRSIAMAVFLILVGDCAFAQVAIPPSIAIPGINNSSPSSNNTSTSAGSGITATVFCEVPGKGNCPPTANGSKDTCTTICNGWNNNRDMCKDSCKNACAEACP